MNVLFIYTEQDPHTRKKPLADQERVQFGISYMSSVLKEKGHETRLFIPLPETRGDLLREIRSFKPSLICFTAVYSEYAHIADLASEIKASYRDVYLVAGGAHISLNPEKCLKDDFDAVCVGEGEQPLAELAEQIEKGIAPSGIKNLYIRNGDVLEKNPTRPFTENLDLLPFPDRQMWEPWVENMNSRASILIGRGCPFKCTYCSNHAIQKLADGRYVRHRSPENIVREVESLLKQYTAISEIYLEVETFGANTSWAKDVCSALERFNNGRQSPISFGANLRITPNSDYSELFDSCKRAGFRFVNIGLESGSERMRNEVLNRKYSNEDFIKTVAEARKSGLEVGVYNMIGIPYETKEDFHQTVKLNRKCQPDWFLLSVFYPYPGTDLHERCIREGLLSGMPDSRLERRRPVIRRRTLSRQYVKLMYSMFPFFVYRGKKPLGGILMVSVMSLISSSPFLVGAYRKFSERRQAKN